MNKRITELSTENLEKKERNFKIILVTFLAILGFLIGVIIYSIFKKGITAIIITPFASIPFLLIFYKYLKEIKSELKRRK